LISESLLCRRITPLYKNEGKCSDVTNYSLISIIPVVGEKIDQNLNWDDDIQMITKKVALGISAIK